ncbi:MAG: 2Fe-2S iron-sulfur cluster binding domain-containing protein [SAR202 cluster bacterium]|nr:2Fe-2S iron-sulfur cluster binding domain-containing protein [SAR202 cluster bacterium]
MAKITFIEPDGKRLEFQAGPGDTLLEVAQENGIDLEGSCEGCMACSTCHVIVDGNWFSRLEPPSDDEKDMLDLAYGLTPTSRLGCQVEITDGLDGLVVALPSEHRNMQG